MFSYDIRCLSITCMHIFLYMLVCENDIFIDIFNTSLNFYISHNGYFHTNELYIKFSNNFSLPDVASSVIPLSNVTSVVFSVTIIIDEDTTGNKSRNLY